MQASRHNHRAYLVVNNQVKAIIYSAPSHNSSNQIITFSLAYNRSKLPLLRHTSLNRSKKTRSKCNSCCQFTSRLSTRSHPRIGLERASTTRSPITNPSRKKRLSSSGRMCHETSMAPQLTYTNGSKQSKPIPTRQGSCQRKSHLQPS